MTPTLFAFVTAAGMFAFGCWGRRNAARLTPQGFSPYGKAKKAQQMRRNGRLIQLSAGILVVLAAVHVVVRAVSS